MTNFSDYLEIGCLYSRADLIEQFNIVDATIKTGIFKPVGSNSIFLFVTENKTSDRVQYEDKLEGDVLSMDGQTMRRTDNLIINHVSDGNEILLFYRKSKYEHPGAAFRYEGPFVCDRHEVRPLGQANHFWFRRAPAVVELKLVTTPEEVRESLHAFVGQGNAFPERARKLVRQTTYWVYDPVLEAFGPSKFVGFVEMTFPTYERALQGYSTGARHDGGRTQKAIRSALGLDYIKDDLLANHFLDWAQQTFGPDSLAGIDSGEWEFITLPEQVGDNPKGGMSGTIKKPFTGRRQGIKISPEQRRAVERHAVDLARAHFHADGWEVKEFGKPYDLYCWRGDEEVYVEVKGTQTLGEAIILTRNEVSHAHLHKNKMVLFLVHGIECSMQNGSVVTSGGTKRVLHPWAPESEALEPKDYYYTLPVVP